MNPDKQRERAYHILNYIVKRFEYIGDVIHSEVKPVKMSPVGNPDLFTIEVTIEVIIKGRQYGCYQSFMISEFNTYAELIPIDMILSIIRKSHQDDVAANPYKSLD